MKKIIISLIMLCCMTAAWAEGTGDGSKERPYSGEWQASDLVQVLQQGDYLSYNTEIKSGSIFITDTQLGEDIVSGWKDCALGNPIGDTPWDQYAYYCWYNDLNDRKQQLFHVTKVERDERVSRYIHISGYYTGRYEGDHPGYLEVSNYNRLQKAVKLFLSEDGKISYSKILLTDDIYLSDGDGNTLNNTFSGILDGDGHTIYGSKDGTRQNRNYLFTYSDGATFKNLTFKHIRKNSEDHSNQAIITSQAKNGCVFENITFENCGAWSNYNNAAAAAGYAENSTFTNIKVTNSDFTVDENQVGAVVAEANNCTFRNIEVCNCECFADDDSAGGVVGFVKTGTFENIEIKNCVCTVYDYMTGGVAGYAIDAHFINCKVDDQSCVYADGWTWFGDAGGITGLAKNCDFNNCINSALIAGNAGCIGGIAGEADSSNIVNCLNTGMVVAVSESKKNELRDKYKNKQMTCKTKIYKGKKYDVREIDLGSKGVECSGGIAGCALWTTISCCANFGYLNETDHTGGIAGDATSINVSDLHISDCLVDFPCSSDVYSIFGHKGVGGGENDNPTVFISNCLDLTGKTVSYTECVSITNLITPSDTVGASIGRLCKDVLGANWEQNIGIDPYPMPSADQKGLYHTRTAKNEYGTIYLPFALQSDENIKYYLFTEDASDKNGVSLKFEYTDNVPPRTPALYRLFNAPSPEEPAEITFYDANDGYQWRDYAKDINGWTMEGTYKQRVFRGNDAMKLYYISDGVIKNGETVTTPAFRAYFWGPNINDLKSSLGANARVRIMIEDEDGETSSISLVELDGNDNENYNENYNENFRGKTYSLMGTEVNDSYRGIVIRNGRKILK